MSGSRELLFTTTQFKFYFFYPRLLSTLCSTIPPQLFLLMLRMSAKFKRTEVSLNVPDNCIYCAHLMGVLTPAQQRFSNIIFAVFCAKRAAKTIRQQQKPLWRQRRKTAAFVLMRLAGMTPKMRIRFFFKKMVEIKFLKYIRTFHDKVDSLSTLPKNLRFVV